MKKVSNNLLLIAGIYSIVCAATFLILGIVFVVASSDACKEQIIEMLERGTFTTSYAGTPQEQAQFIQTVYSILGITMLVVCVFQFINVFLSFTARRKEAKPLYILNIVFGVLSMVVVNVVGAIFGLIAFNHNSEAQVE
jgi:FtsH-binding integral membrane protein